MSTSPCLAVKNAATSNREDGRRAEHDMNGMVRMVTKRSRRFSRVRVAMMAGTPQPKPIR